jgi:DNA-binding transcriptional ArsR family regulator
MSDLVKAWAWRQKVGSATRKLILAKLADCADDDGWSWWRQGRMAEECEVSRSTIQKHLAELRGLGLLQVIEEKREDGGRGANYYRLLGPWTDDPNASHDPPARRSGRGARGMSGGSPRDGQAPAREPGTIGIDSREPSGEEGPQTPTGIEPLGRRRFRVPSNSTEGVKYVADLDRGRCTCQAGRDCRHLEAASIYEEEATTDRRREFRDAVWDVLIDLFGKPTNRAEADRGLQVAELAEMLADEDEKVVPRDPEVWAAEVQSRYASLVRDWGTGKVTLHSLVKNWHLAGRLVRPGSNTVGQQQKLGFTKA